HRGRLNVLFNIVGKPLAQLFAEFDGNFKGGQAGGSGDVKYHLGASGEHLQMFGDGEIKVTLISPSPNICKCSPEAPKWYFTSPEPPAWPPLKLPSNSANSCASGLPTMLNKTFRRPR